MLARDLVNEPANILGPVEFAAKAKALTKLGVEVEILGRAGAEEAWTWRRCSASRRARRGRPASR